MVKSLCVYLTILCPCPHVVCVHTHYTTMGPNKDESLQGGHVPLVPPSMLKSAHTHVPTLAPFLSKSLAVSSPILVLHW